MAVTIPELPIWLTKQNVVLALLIVYLIAHFAYLVWESQQNPLLRFSDVMTADNGRLASNKVFQAFAFIISAWIMVHMTIGGDMSEGMMLGWVSVWGGLTVANKIVNNRAVVDAAKMSTIAPPPLPEAPDQS